VLDIVRERSRHGQIDRLLWRIPPGVVDDRPSLAPLPGEGRKRSITEDSIDPGPITRDTIDLANVRVVNLVSGRALSIAVKVLDRRDAVDRRLVQKQNRPRLSGVFFGDGRLSIEDSTGVRIGDGTGPVDRAGELRVLRAGGKP
jgi:hypothetical protein